MMPIDPMNPNPPYAPEMEGQDPFALSPYLAARGQEGPSLTGAFAPPPEGGMVMGGGGPQGDPDTMQGDPLMDEVRRGSDPRMGLGMLAGSALAGLFGGGASEAAGHAAGASQDFLLQNLQKKQGLMAQDRERKFKMGEEAIQGAHEMMKQLHGKDMAGLPDHIKAEMTRLTELYNQKMLDGLTDKEAREILAVGARMQQLLQSAGADPSVMSEQARLAGMGERTKSAATIGVSPDDPTYRGQTPAQWSAERRAEETNKARIESARIAASRAEASLGRRLEVAELHAGNAAVAAAVSQNNMMGEAPLPQEVLDEIFRQGVARAKAANAGGGGGGNSPKPGMVKGPDGVYRKVQ